MLLTRSKYIAIFFGVLIYIAIYGYSYYYYSQGIYTIGVGYRVYEYYYLMINTNSILEFLFGHGIGSEQVYVFFGSKHWIDHVTECSQRLYNTISYYNGGLFGVAAFLIGNILFFKKI